MERGFSLSELLVSLVLISSISLALLKQQWQLHRLVSQTNQQARAWLQTNNDRARGIYPKAAQQGLSLIELMISMVLAVGMMTLMIQVYVQVRQHFHTAQMSINQTSRMQIVLSFIRQSVQKSGFTPCGPLNHLVTKDRRSGQVLETIEASTLAKGAYTLHGMYEQFGQVEAIQDQRYLRASSVQGLSDQYPLIIADCQHAEVHEAYKILFRKDHIEIALTQPLAYAYVEPIYIGEWVEDSFVVKDNRQGIRALSYHRHHHSEELMIGVQALDYHLEKIAGKTLVHLIVTMNKESPYMMDVRVHNS